ncbi:MAG: alpha/beta hydrolase-fold protein, partial [Verrucomicrobiota bacterium]
YQEYERLRMHHWLSEKINRGQLQLFCVDSIVQDSLYASWMNPADRIQRQMQYEEYVLNEVMPLMAAKNGHECTISHGLSLGAYQAANIAFRHPHLFRKLCAFSGRYDLTLSVEHFGDLFHGYYDGNVYFHNPSHFLQGMPDGRALDHLKRMDIVFTIGKEDPFLGDNHHVSRTLEAKGVSHAMHEWEGRAHEGYSWRRMAPLYL